MKDLTASVKSVEAKLEALKARAGRLDTAEYPSGTLSPSMLKALLETHRAKGRRYDMVVVDYADIMRPDDRTDNVIENSKTIGLGLRAIAFDFDCAVLTATQTNREGFKATVAKAEHVAEDFNKIRTADLVISINKTEEEAKKGEARLYFAASRNQESGFTIIIKQDLSRMKFVESVIAVE
jgi:replicative DNA helicase